MRIRFPFFSRYSRSFFISPPLIKHVVLSFLHLFLPSHFGLSRAIDSASAIGYFKMFMYGGASLTRTRYVIGSRSRRVRQKNDSVRRERRGEVDLG